MGEAQLELDLPLGETPAAATLFARAALTEVGVTNIEIGNPNALFSTP